MAASCEPRPRKPPVPQEADCPFYPAEAYHQDFMEHPSYPYIVIHDAQKLADLERIFPDVYRSDPVLVSAKRSSN
jgi:peptide-methionine (S)-S-oxide reductase